MKKKILSIALAVILIISSVTCLSLFSVSAQSDYAYTAVNNTVFTDFEAFTDTMDMATLSYTAPHIVNIDSTGALKQILDTKTAISGDKSMKISWNSLSTESKWPAIRFWGTAGTFRNQALYFDIVCPSDWNGVVVLYGNDNTGTPMEQYKYKLVIKGSNDVQHIKIPFNEFKSSKDESLTKTEWETLCNLPKCTVLKFQIDKTGGLADNSFMIIDNLMFVKADSTPNTSITYNYTTYTGTQTQEPGTNPSTGNEGKEQGENNPSENTPVVIETEGTGYYELKKFDNAVDSANLTSAEITDLLKGDGIYANVKAKNDTVMKIALSDGTNYLNYEVDVKGSESTQLVNVDYTDFVTARGSFGQLNFAKATLKVTFTQTAELYAVGTYSYAEMYAALHTEEIPSGATPSGEAPSGNTPSGNTTSGETPSGENPVNNQADDTSVSPKTGYNSNIVLVSLVAVIAMGALVVTKKSLLSK